MRTKRFRGKGDTDLMSFMDISKALGLAAPASAKYIHDRALRKLRLNLENRKDELRELYTSTSEQSEKVAPLWKISELPLSQFPLMPRKMR